MNYDSLMNQGSSRRSNTVLAGDLDPGPPRQFAAGMTRGWRPWTPQTPRTPRGIQGARRARKPQSGARAPDRMEK